MAKTFASWTTYFMQQSASCSCATSQATIYAAQSMHQRYTQEFGSQCAFLDQHR